MEKDSTVKGMLKRSVFYKLLVYYRKVINRRKAASDRKNILKQWYKAGRPAPPPHIYKIAVIRQYASQLHSQTLIETGTYLGETINACKHLFKKLISIELDDKLYENAVNLFAHEPHIALYKGDSGEVLEKVLANITGPCLFWLDGHYSEGITAKGKLNTPIISELGHIFNRHIKDQVILIDDARCFNGENDYPTITYLKDFVTRHDKALKFIIADDIIRIY
jgi:hypothetical protein